MIKEVAMKIDPVKARMNLIAELRSQVLMFDGPIQDSPQYQELALLLISEAILGNYPR